MKAKIKSLKKNGFALVATLLLMVLLSTLAIGLLSLSTIALRSGTNNDLGIARANARMALMLAVGELQKYAGPDQRVTGEASIFENPDGSDKLSNRLWTGVWRTDHLKAEPAAPAGMDALIYRKDTVTGSDAGSLVDRRISGYDRKAEVLTWLVSNPNPGQAIDPTTFTTGIEMVGEGSSTSDPVYVPEVTTTHGSYAWWVSDENTKARFDLGNSGTAPAWTHPVRSGIDAMQQLAAYANFSPEERLRAITAGTGDHLVRTKGGAPADLKEHYHDLTFSAAGVIADSLNGGLKRDLTAFIATGNLADSGTSKPEITDTTPLFDVPMLKKISPQFGVLRSWAKMGENVSGNSVDIVPPVSAANAIRGYNTSPTYLSAGLDLRSQKTAPLHPVIVDAGITYGLSLIDLGPGVSDPTMRSCKLRFHYFPRVVLWNPYQVELNPADYAVHIGMPHAFSTQIKMAATATSPERTTFQNYCSPNVITTNGNNNLPHRPVFHLPGAKFLPGQALVFTADPALATGPGQTIPWGVNSRNGVDNAVSPTASSIAHFRLTSSATPPLNTSFSMDSNYRYDVDPDRSTYAILPIQDAGNGGGYKQLYYKLWQVKGNTGPGSVYAIQGNDTAAYPPLQYIAQTEDGTWGSDAPWIAGIPSASTEQLRKTEDGTTPYFRGKWGQRFQWFVETDENRSIAPGFYKPIFQQHNLIANNNLRANWFFRSPVEVAYRASAAAGRYSHGIFIDDMYSWDWNNPMLSPLSTPDGNQVSPFGMPAMFGDTRFPMISIPTGDTPVLSIGAFQHAPLSVFSWHPTFAVGNSFADPRGKRQSTTNYAPPGTDDTNAGSRASWSVGVHKRNWGNYRQEHLDSGMGVQSYLYDLSYEANHTLWDRFFLSSVPRTFTVGSAIPNTRVQSLASNASEAAKVLDGNEAAAHLMIAGAFNVNSTREAAWAALFASFRENPEMTISGEGGSTITGNDIYSRLLKPAGSAYSDGGAFDKSTWEGYRKLTDDEIRELAKQIVAEVKQRGPFLSLSDFVNRRLVEPPATSGAETELTKTGLKGALQAAIDRTTINTQLLDEFPIPKTEFEMGEPPNSTQISYGTSYPNPTYPFASGSAAFGPKPDHNHFADSKLVGAPAFLTQADMLQKLGSVLSARGDTFTIRAYGASNGTRVWAEAIVQRTPEPIVPAANGIDCSPDGAGVFGRKFAIVSFRWLNNDEI